MTAAEDIDLPPGQQGLSQIEPAPGADQAGTRGQIGQVRRRNAGGRGLPVPYPQAATLQGAQQQPAGQPLLQARHSPRRRLPNGGVLASDVLKAHPHLPAAHRPYILPPAIVLRAAGLGGGLMRLRGPAEGLGGGLMRRRRPAKGFQWRRTRLGGAAKGLGGGLTRRRRPAKGFRWRRTRLGEAAKGLGGGLGRAVGNAQEEALGEAGAGQKDLAADGHGLGLAGPAAHGAPQGAGGAPQHVGAGPSGCGTGGAHHRGQHQVFPCVHGPQHGLKELFHGVDLLSRLTGGGTPTPARCRRCTGPCRRW